MTSDTYFDYDNIYSSDEETNNISNNTLKKIEENLEEKRS